MPGLLARFILPLLLCLAALPAALAAGIPRDEPGFSAYMVEQLAREMPDLKLAPSGRLTLEGKRPDGSSSGQINLERVYDFCARNFSICDSAIDSFVKGIAQMTREEMLPLDRGMVRLAVRPRAYIDQVKQKLGADPAPVYARHLTAHLVAVPVLDFPRSSRFVNARDLAALKLDEEQLFKLGEANLRAAQKPLAEVTKVPPPKAVGRIFNEDYAASRIIFHDDWNELANKLDGVLVLMLPTPDFLLYGGEVNDDALAAMQTFGMEVAARSTRPLSPLLIRWTPTGWEEVK
ncbi:MAG TPA: hypothetical protein VH105_26065 [Burkholderiales bacterium]|jgi:uncharacterized protein YtpQ (UPF0354 family)|nr:hypothetical protein [Burkholderiales bacterium]